MFCFFAFRDFVFFFKQKTAYEMRISDWSSDVCSSDLAGRAGFFDDAGYPTGSGWDEVDFPNIGDQHAYALEVSGDSMEPVYRDGDIIIVSPQASIRRGDRLVLKPREGEVMAKGLLRQTAHKVELKHGREAWRERVGQYVLN